MPTVLFDLAYQVRWVSSWNVMMCNESTFWNAILNDKSRFGSDLDEANS